MKGYYLISLLSIPVLFLLVSCNLGTSSSGGGSCSTAQSAIAGTWICTNAGDSASSPGQTNIFVFNADATFVESNNGSAYLSGTYVFSGSNIFFYSTNETNYATAFIDSTGYLYFNPGNVFQLISGSGWEGTYESQAYESLNAGPGTNIIYTNFLVLTSTALNITIVNQTNLIYTNGTVYQNTSGGPPSDGTVLPWSSTAAPYDWSFSVGPASDWFILDGNYLMLSFTNSLALSGYQYVK